MMVFFRLSKFKPVVGAVSRTYLVPPDQPCVVLLHSSISGVVFPSPHAD